MNVPLCKLIKPRAVALTNRKLLSQIIFRNYSSHQPKVTLPASSIPWFSKTQKIPSARHGSNVKWFSSSVNNNDGDGSSPDSDDNNANNPEHDGSNEQAVNETGLDDCTLSLTPEQVRTLSGGDPEIVSKIRYIQLEHEVLRQEGILVPTKPITLTRWQELINLSSRSKRKKFFIFLFKLEKTKENDALRKEERKKQRAEFLQTLPDLPPLGEDPDGMIYGLNRNTLFVRLREDTEFAFYHNRLVQEMKFGQPLVFDVGYTEHMNQREAKNCAKQLELCFHMNRFHKYPFDLRFCNANEEEYMVQYMKRLMPRMYDMDYPIHVTSESYLDLFPRERLVYLTPHAKDTLMEFDTDTVYIIGALVDKSDPRPFSLAKAKKENIQMKRLPLDLYLDWGIGNKSLTLDQMMNILLDVRLYKDWNRAFSHIPRRKIKNWGRSEEDDFQHQVRNARGIRGKIDPPAFITRPTTKSNEFNSAGFHKVNPKSASSSNRSAALDLETEDDDDLSGFRNPRFKRSSSGSPIRSHDSNKDEGRGAHAARVRIRNIMDD